MKCEDVSAVILAGGRSSRMGVSKAELPWDGTTLLLHQLRKLRALGIRDLIVCGSVHVEGAKSVTDIYPQKGPLGGIHAGLLAAKRESVLVTGVDTPLVPERIYRELIAAHTGGSTVLAHGDKLEPLIAVYDRSLIPTAEELLLAGRCSVRGLLNEAWTKRFLCPLDEKLLCDCNTPEDYAAALKLRGI